MESKCDAAKIAAGARDCVTRTNPNAPGETWHLTPSTRIEFNVWTLIRSTVSNWPFLRRSIPTVAVEEYNRCRIGQSRTRRDDGHSLSEICCDSSVAVAVRGGEAAVKLTPAQVAAVLFGTNR